MTAAGDRRAILGRAKRAGAEVKQGKGGHMKVFVNGRLVTVVGSSGSRGSSGDLQASVRSMRRAGLDV